MADELKDKSLEELERMMAEGVPEPDPSPEPTTEPESEQEIAKDPEPTDPAAPAEPSDHDADLRVAAEAQRALEESRRDAELAEMRAHNSRLAGKIGDLMQKLRTRPEPGYGSDVPVDDERFTGLQTKMDEIERTQKSEARARAIQEEVGAFRERPEFKAIPLELINEVAPKFVDAWTKTLEEEDPDVARLSARSLMLGVAAEANKVRIERMRVQVEERRADQTQKLAEAKRNAASSASGSTPPPASGKRPLEALSLDELEAMLRANSR